MSWARIKPGTRSKSGAGPGWKSKSTTGLIYRANRVGGGNADFSGLIAAAFEVKDSQEAGAGRKEPPL